MPDDYVARFDLDGVVWGSKTNVFGYDRATSDKRAFFTNYGSTKEFDEKQVSSGWMCWKFCGLDSNDKLAQQDGVPETGNFLLPICLFSVWLKCISTMPRQMPV